MGYGLTALLAWVGISFASDRHPAIIERGAFPGLTSIGVAAALAAVPALWLRLVVIWLFYVIGHFAHCGLTLTSCG